MSALSFRRMLMLLKLNKITFKAEKSKLVFLFCINFSSFSHVSVLVDHPRNSSVYFWFHSKTFAGTSAHLLPQSVQIHQRGALWEIHVLLLSCYSDLRSDSFCLSTFLINHPLFVCRCWGDDPRLGSADPVVSVRSSIRRWLHGNAPFLLLSSPLQVPTGTMFVVKDFKRRVYGINTVYMK